MTRYGMLIDASTCAGCDACTMACKYQNATPSGMYWCKVLKGEYGEYPNSGQTVLPIACQHCQDAPCVSACPTGASYYDENQCVQVDYEKCIGCRMCINAALQRAQLPRRGPGEDAVLRRLRHDALRADARVRASHRRGGEVRHVQRAHRAGEDPSCVQTCITKSRWFGDLDDPTSEINEMIKKLGAKPLMEAYGTRPSVYYAGTI